MVDGKNENGHRYHSCFLTFSGYQVLSLPGSVTVVKFECGLTRDFQRANMTDDWFQFVRLVHTCSGFLHYEKKTKIECRNRRGNNFLLTTSLLNEAEKIMVWLMLMWLIQFFGGKRPRKFIDAYRCESKAAAPIRARIEWHESIGMEECIAMWCWNKM